VDEIQSASNKAFNVTPLHGTIFPAVALFGLVDSEGFLAPRLVSRIATLAIVSIARLKWHGPDVVADTLGQCYAERIAQLLINLTALVAWVAQRLSSVGPLQPLPSAECTAILMLRV
jgi:hypothetical protein